MFGVPKISNLSRELQKISSRLVRKEALVAGQWKLTEKSFSVVHPGNGENLIDIANCGVKDRVVKMKIYRRLFICKNLRVCKNQLEISTV